MICKTRHDHNNNNHRLASSWTVLVIGFIFGLVIATVFHEVRFSSSVDVAVSMMMNMMDSPVVSLVPSQPLAAAVKDHEEDHDHHDEENRHHSTGSDDWPGVAVSSLGHPLVYKGSNFVQNTRALTLQYLDEFLQVYQDRPDKVNLCGIRINHALALYLTIKVLRPTTIIESGVNAGQSTYFMRAAAGPNATIYAIDPLDKPICAQGKRWIDTQGPTEYLTGKNFKDIVDIDWGSKIKSGKVDPDRTLAFLDDHLVVFDRLAVLMNFGIRHVLLEDNYKVNEGGTHMDRAGFTPKQMFYRVDDDSKYLWNNVISYAEFPPLVAPILAQRWKGQRKKAGGFLFATDTNLDIVPPILKAHVEGHPDYQVYENICKALGLDPLIQDDDSYMQIMNYNQFTYMELAPIAPRLRATVSKK